MFRIAVFILLLFAAAAGFAWLADNPGSVTVQWDWFNKGEAYTFGLITVIVALAIIVLLVMMVWWVVSGIINSPKSFGRWRAGRRRDKGYAALSKGLIAAGAGNAPLARQLTKESDKLLENEPLVAMLDAQTALLEGDKPVARRKFETMLHNDETRLLGLRGLYVEAEQEGEMEAAAHFATEANKHAPGTPWAGQAVLKVQTLGSQWADALQTLDSNRSSGLVSKAEYSRKKAVILTAQALDEEDSEPAKAKAHALAAHKLAPDLVPAAVAAARISQRLNDNRKASKVLDTTWKKSPHPEVADLYVNLKSGDSAREKLKRAQKLVQKQPEDNESHFALAKAAVDAGEFHEARTAMAKCLENRPTERACLIMADIEEAEHGDRGRVREWLSRAVSAPKDPVWIADGTVSEEWAAVSPVSGRLDAFEWKEPVEQIGGPSTASDYSKLATLPLEEPKDVTDVSKDATVATTAAAAAGATITVAAGTEDKDDIEDAEIVEESMVEPKNDNEEKSESAATTEKAEEDEKEEVSEATSDETKLDESNDNEPSDSRSESTGNSPYANTNLDPDDDGVIDRRPDDPGAPDEVPKKKGWLF